MEALVLALFDRCESGLGGNQRYGTQDGKLLNDQLHAFVVLEKFLQSWLDRFAEGARVIEKLDHSDIALGIAKNLRCGIAQQGGCPVDNRLISRPFRIRPQLAGLRLYGLLDFRRRCARCSHVRKRHQRKSRADDRDPT